MSTIGWLFILIAVFTIRQSFKGRAGELPEDLSDIFLALARGDTDALGEVFTRKGEGLDFAGDDKYLDPGILSTHVKGQDDAGIAAAAIKRGNAAKGYRWTATGPDYYDCSGLMWRACQDVKLYTGARFTTFNAESATKFSRVTTPAKGDLVVWPTHHMGVVTGDDQFYSARSVRSGIGFTTISGFRKDNPIYLRPGVKK